MSDNRKYYYLKLKENYFDEDAIVLLESMQDGDCHHYTPASRHRRTGLADLYETGGCGAAAKRRTVYEQH